MKSELLRKVLVEELQREYLRRFQVIRCQVTAPVRHDILEDLSSRISTLHDLLADLDRVSPAISNPFQKLLA
jgi:hypothetical protein